MLVRVDALTLTLSHRERGCSVFSLSLWVYGPG